MKRIIGKIKHCLWREQWNVGIVKANKKEILEKGIDPSQINWLFPEKKGGFYADPFLVQAEEGYYLFLEEYDYSSGKGVISVSEITCRDEEFQATKPQIILQENFHLSYPQIKKVKNRWIMTIEAAESNELIVYEAVEFPLKWKRAETLLENIPILDPTFFEYQDRQWMFCARMDKGENSSLFAYYLDHATKNWKEHYKSPIREGLDNSRPAGMIFSLQGRTFRPAQNCEGTYGKSIVINEILELTPDKYKERKFCELKAERYQKYNQGTHTMNFAGEYAVFDAKRFMGLKKYLDSFYSRFFKSQ